MKNVLKLTENLYVDLTTGYYSCSEIPAPAQRLNRLTHGQLKLLNYLVKNREILCTHSMLEGLFDSELKENAVPGIKQQLWRMKMRLNSADNNFDAETARHIFQSVSGRGYIFHLPDCGKVIKVRTPIDEIIQIDWKFIKEQQVESIREKENLKSVFYSVVPNNRIILQVVCNQLHVCNSEYKSLEKEIAFQLFDTSEIFSPAFLIGEEGSGKSTLLCSLAVKLASDCPNWNVYYMDIENVECEDEIFSPIIDYMIENGLSRTRKNILCIDNPSANLENFKKLYQLLEEIKSPYIYLITAERASRMLRLLENDTVYQENHSFRVFYIENSRDKENGKMYMHCSFIRFGAIKIFFFSETLKKEIVHQMIFHFSDRGKLTTNLVDKCKDNLIYNRRTIVDVFLDFKREYNILASRCRGVKKDYYIPKVDMDWDEWKRRCESLDRNCTKLKVSETFPYVAVCYLFGIMTTFEFIEKMTGYSYKSIFLKLFPEGLGEDIQYANGHFVLRHETVAENYFAFHPEITPYSCLQDLVSHNYMDEKTVLLFRKIIFIYPLCHYQSKTWIIFIKELLNLFQQNEFYMKIVKRYHQASTKKSYIYHRKQRDCCDFGHMFEFVFTDCNH